MTTLELAARSANRADDRGSCSRTHAATGADGSLIHLAGIGKDNSRIRLHPIDPWWVSVHARQGASVQGCRQRRLRPATCGCRGCAGAGLAQ